MGVPQAEAGQSRDGPSRNSTGFRFFRRDGLELVPPMRVLWEPNPFAPNEAA